MQLITVYEVCWHVTSLANVNAPFYLCLTGRVSTFKASLLNFSLFFLCVLRPLFRNLVTSRGEGIKFSKFGIDCQLNSLSIESFTTGINSIADPGSSGSQWHSMNRTKYYFNCSWRIWFGSLLLADGDHVIYKRGVSTCWHGTTLPPSDLKLNWSEWIFMKWCFLHNSMRE